MASVTDGTTNTACVVETPADMAVEWTKPGDWELEEAMIKKLMSSREEGFYALTVAGGVKFIARENDTAEVAKFFMRNDGQVVDLKEVE